MRTSTILASLYRGYFRRAGHAFCVTKKGTIFVNLGQFKDENPLTSMYIESFRSLKMPKQSKEALRALRNKCLKQVPLYVSSHIYYI